MGGGTMHIMKQVVLLAQLHSSICMGEAEGHGVHLKSVPTLYLLHWIKDCYTGHVTISKGEYS